MMTANFLSTITLSYTIGTSLKTYGTIKNTNINPTCNSDKDLEFSKLDIELVKGKLCGIVERDRPTMDELFSSIILNPNRNSSTQGKYMTTHNGTSSTTPISHPN